MTTQTSEKLLRLRAGFSQNFDSGSKDNTESCRNQLRHSRCGATSAM